MNRLTKHVFALLVACAPLAAQGEIVLFAADSGTVFAYPGLYLRPNTAPAMSSIVFVEPPRDNAGAVRRSLSRAHNWSAYRGNALSLGDLISTPASSTWQFNQGNHPSNRAMVDYSLRRSHAFSSDAYKEQ
jgi:hypothetical protein